MRDSTTVRPWTRWWWLGSALTPAEITRSLEAFAAVGLGGVEVSPIYGVPSASGQYAPFLSEAWLSLLRHTIQEATRLNLGVDLILGTGWPFGGPWVRPEDAAQRLTITDGVPSIAPTKQVVKRAAPGGEGLVVDHFSHDAITRYVAHFDKLPTGLRAIFNDSWEVYGANATPTIFSEFEKRRGYALTGELLALSGSGESERVRRVRTDYRLTIHELVINAFLTPATAFAATKNAKLRNQSHGAPGHLLDLYAAVEIPESEWFGSAALGWDGLVPTSETAFQEWLVPKLAASAASVLRKPLVSNESYTWLGEHGHATLAELKKEADLLFLVGVNHLFYHGTAFSPSDAPWPGWLFYASSELTPNNPLWTDLPAFNRYVSRVQTMLQTTKSDTDILLYYPIWDQWASDSGNKDFLQFATVHAVSDWLAKPCPVFYQTVKALWKNGYSFDFVSDSLLETLTDVTGKTIVLAGCTTMPPATLKRLQTLTECGATLVVLDALPTDVPGLFQHQERRALLTETAAALSHFHCIQTKDLLTTLKQLRMRHEDTTTDLALHRRRGDSSTEYFCVNLGKQAQTTVKLHGTFPHVTATDPLLGTTGTLVTDTTTQLGSTICSVVLAPGQSLLLTASNMLPKLPPFPRVPSTNATTLTKPWQVIFKDGGPTLPAPQTITALTSWTEWPTENALLRTYSGSATYRTTFDAPSSSESTVWLDLGAVRDSTSVKLNGVALGTVIAVPFRLPLPKLRPQENLLEITVTNSMVNRLIHHSKTHPEWPEFFFVDINYKPFRATDWPIQSSGLLGPVRLLHP